MSRVRLALVNASQAAANTRRNFRRELDADLVEFDATDGEVPPTFDYGGFVVTGSRVSVYWDEEWIDRTRAWVAEAVDRGLPALGICWGHQLLADVLGGTVEDMGEYEIGYRTVRKTGETPLTEGLDEEFLVFTTHSDAVTELPPGAELTLENDYGVHGFRKDRVFGVQAHPEYDTQTAEAVTLAKALPEERIESVLSGITDENYRRACAAKRLFDDFVGYVEAVRDAEGRDAEGRDAVDCASVSAPDDGTVASGDSDPTVGATRND